MNEHTGHTGYASVPAASERSVLGVFGWVMGLVGIGIAFMALGSFIGRDFARGTALACTLGGFAMLMIGSFGGQRFRVGSFAMGWFFATALAIGLGLGRVLSYFVSTEADTLAQAIAGTAGTVVAMGALGLFLSKDLAAWMRPVSLAVFVVFAGLIVWSLFAGALPIWVSFLVYALSAFLLVIDFNYLRKHGTEDDAIWLATGIFVSIVNIFMSLLNIMGGD